MKKVLFSLGVLGLFANADAVQHLFMRQNEPLIEECPFKSAKLRSLHATLLIVMIFLQPRKSTLWFVPLIATMKGR